MLIQSITHIALILSMHFAISVGETRIIGGVDVTNGTYPWFAHASNRSCGGMLIAVDWVLTAAHCPAPCK